MMVVVDASAAAALLFDEPEASTIAAILEGKRLAAPTLIRYEITSVCIKKIRRYPGRRAGLQEALGLFSWLGVDEVQVPLDEMSGLAEDTDLTAYDAAYLWLARHLQAPLVTLDRCLAEAARTLGLEANG